MYESIISVLVVGYGTMGRGIAKTFAENGFETNVLTRDPSRTTDLPEGSTAIAELPESAPDLVIESIPEELALKPISENSTACGDASISQRIHRACRSTRLPALAHKDRFVAIHYMQPAEAFPLVEVCRLEETSDEDTAYSRCVARSTRNPSSSSDQLSAF